MSDRWTRRRLLSTGRDLGLGLAVLGLPGPWAPTVGHAQEEGAGPVMAPGVSYRKVSLGMSSGFGSVRAEVGRELLRGSLAWFNEVNARRGIHGRELSLLALDDGGDPDRTALNTANLLSGGVFCFFGFVGSANLLRALNVIRRQDDPDLVVVGGVAGGQSPSLPPYGNHWVSLRPSLEEEVEVLLRPLLELGRRRIGLYVPLDPDGRALAQAVSERLVSAGAEPPVETTYRPNGALERELETAAGHLASRGVEAVICTGGAGPSADLFRWLRETGWEVPVLLDSRVDGDSVLARLLEAPPSSARIENLVQSRVAPVFDDPALGNPARATQGPELALYRRMMAKWKPQVPEGLRTGPDDDRGPTAFGYEGFRHARLLTRALEEAGPEPDRRSFRLALERLLTPTEAGGDPVAPDGVFATDLPTAEEAASLESAGSEARGDGEEAIESGAPGLPIRIARVHDDRWTAVDWSVDDPWVAEL